jgi:L-threonylcarbamoyladenylate synthase
MQTVLTESPEIAAGFIRSGGIVAFPTETVYGLGANLFDPIAIKRIFEAKIRPADNPLIAHIGDVSQIDLVASEIPEAARRFMERYFPGPLTLVLPKTDKVPKVATAGLATIGVRMPSHELALRFLKACNTPVAAPSANLSGRPSPTTWQAVVEDLTGRIDCILQGDPTEIGIESTVVDCTSGIPMVLRSGGVTLEQLQSVVPETELYKRRGNEKPRSPGMKHRHYSPRADVILVDDLSFVTTDRSAFIGREKPAAEFEDVKVCTSDDEYAQSVFGFFRDCDRRGIKTIYCQKVEERGIGLALMDRLRRAASGK